MDQAIKSGLENNPALIDELGKDMLESQGLLKATSDKPELAGAWNKIRDNATLRMRPDILDQVAKFSKNERYNELLHKRSQLAYDGKDLTPDELSELNSLKTSSHSSANSIIPNNDEFNSSIKVKSTDPQPGTNPKFYQSEFTVIEDRIVGVKPGYYDYVITMDGEIKIGSGHYFLSNSSEYVKAAGNMEIDNLGKITHLDVNSGHYKPTYENNVAAKQLFESMGLFQE
jgi:hypothetical protein